VEGFYFGKVGENIGGNNQ